MKVAIVYRLPVVGAVRNYPPMPDIVIDRNQHVSDRGLRMEYAVAAGGIGISDILQKMSANPWVIVAIAVVIIVIYFVTIRA